MSSYWDDVLALAPTLLWKLNETSGVVAADSGINARPGTIAGAPTGMGAATLIPNVQDDGSLTLDGSNDHVTCVDPANPNTWAPTPSALTAILWVQFNNFSATRDCFGKLGSWQVWITNAGKIQYHLSPDWTSTLCAQVLVINTPYMIALVKSGAGTGNTGKLYINGVQAGTVNHISQLDTSGDVFVGHSGNFVEFPGRAQGFALWEGTALDATTILALYNKGILLVNEPPTPPASITVPVGAETYTNSLTVEYTAGTDPESDPLQYEGEYSLNNGGIWHPLHALQNELTYDWDISHLSSAAAKVRFRSYDGEFYSDWIESDTFVIGDGVAMDFWDRILVLSPAVLWKMDGDALDATNYGRHGTLVGGPTIGQPSIIPAVPEASSILFDGVDDLIEHAAEDWMRTGEQKLAWNTQITLTGRVYPHSYCVIVFVKPTAVNRALHGLMADGGWDLFRQTDASNLLYSEALPNPIQGAAALVQDELNMVVFQKFPTLWQIGFDNEPPDEDVPGFEYGDRRAELWLNGVKVVDQSLTANPSGGLLGLGLLRFGQNQHGVASFEGYAQGFAYFPQQNLTPEEIEALWEAANEAPNAPLAPVLSAVKVGLGSVTLAGSILISA